MYVCMYVCMYAYISWHWLRTSTPKKIKCHPFVYISPCHHHTLYCSYQIIKQPDSGRSRNKQSRIWRLKRAKCTTTQLYHPTDINNNNILSIETFNG